MPLVHFENWAKGARTNSWTNVQVVHAKATKVESRQFGCICRSQAIRDRHPPVRHYPDHKCCLSFTPTELGNPARETLTRWIDELYPDTRLRMVGRAPNVLHPIPDRTELERTVEALKRDIRKLQLEHNLLKKATELLKKGLGVNLRLLSNREKVMLINALRSSYAVSELLVELNLARSSYFYHRARLLDPEKYAQARQALSDVFAQNHRCYGYRRMRAALGNEDVRLSEKVVRRLMGIMARHTPRHQAFQSQTHRPLPSRCCRYVRASRCSHPCARHD
jgi:predicted DNA binding CopG/RHH family protein